jgi:hypothetical protein
MWQIKTMYALHKQLVSSKAPSKLPLLATNGKDDGLPSSSSFAYRENIAA